MNVYRSVTFLGSFTRFQGHISLTFLSSLLLALAIPALSQSPRRDITIADIVKAKGVRELMIAPDGLHVAYIIRESIPDLNTYRSTLFVQSVDGNSKPKKLVEQSEISRLNWSPNSQFVTYLTNVGGISQVFRVGLESGKPEPLISHKSSVQQYEWSSDGQKIVFIASRPVPPDEQASLDAKGVVFDVPDATKATQLWSFSVADRETDNIWEGKKSITSIDLSPDGRSVVVTIAPLDGKVGIQDIGVISTDGGTFTSLVDWEGRQFQPRWSPDGKSIVFSSDSDSTGKPAAYSGLTTSIFVITLETRKVIRAATSRNFVGDLSWSADGRSILFESDDRSISALYEVSIASGIVKKVSNGADHLSEFSLDAPRARAACLRQSLTSPPELAVLNLGDGTPRTITDLNPEYRDIRLGDISEIRWRNEFGNETNGFLIKPIDYVPGKRYPFLLILYAFSSKFVSQAQWMTSYPAQVFAANGYAVLLMNYPKFRGRRYGDSKQALFDRIYNPLSSIENAVDTVVKMGIADPKRKGMMGWSYGSLLTDLTITQRPSLFNVASSGEGAMFNPGMYWLISREQDFYDSILGGSPWGGGYENYRKVSPALNADRAQVPILMEYAAINIRALEYYTALKKSGKAVELVFYPGETHIFNQPKHRIYSMQRNLDWFNFWLQGKEDSDPAQKDQYVRWREMRKLQGAKLKIRSETVK